MGKRSGTQTVVNRPDDASAAYLEHMRTAGKGAANSVLNAHGSLFSGPLTDAAISDAMNPYIGNVIDGVRGEFDNLRGQSLADSNAQATAAGAFGGSRHGVMAGARLGELDRAQASQIGGLLNQGYNNAVRLADHNRMLTDQQRQEGVWRQNQAMRFLNMGMGPVGFSQTQSGTAGSNPWTSAIGGATAGSSFGVPGALIGGGLGLLGGLFG